MSNNQSPSTWGSQSGYVWSLIGSAVGFANVLSFSAQAYKNGGGAFLIPYFLALFVLGIPLLLLEGLIGYRWKLPLVNAYGKVANRTGRWLGWISVLACLSIGAFYIVLTGYSASYIYFSAMNLIPLDTKAFFQQEFLKTTASLSEVGTISWPIFFSLIAVSIATWFVLVRNVRDGIEKICSLFMPLLAVLVTLFAISVNFLPGGLSGWYYYLTPDFSKLLSVDLWRDIFGQLFFSLSLGLGIIVGYSRHTDQSVNIGRAMLWTALGDFTVSFISGSAIFGCLAHISYTQGIPFDQIIKTDSPFEIGFVIFPRILQFFHPVFNRVLAPLFFFCIFIAGITGVFSIVESIAGNIQYAGHLTRKKAVTLAITAMSCLGVFFCLGNAAHLLDAIVPMVVGTNMLLGGLALITAFMFINPTLRQDPLWRRKDGSWGWNGLMLRFVAPLLLAAILLFNLGSEFGEWDLAKSVRWIWFASVAMIAALLAQIQPSLKHK